MEKRPIKAGDKFPVLTGIEAQLGSFKTPAGEQLLAIVTIQTRHGTTVKELRAMTDLDSVETMATYLQDFLKAARKTATPGGSVH